MENLELLKEYHQVMKDYMEKEVIVQNYFKHWVEGNTKLTLEEAKQEIERLSKEMEALKDKANYLIEEHTKRSREEAREKYAQKQSLSSSKIK